MNTANNPRRVSCELRSSADRRADPLQCGSLLYRKLIKIIWFDRPCIKGSRAPGGTESSAESERTTAFGAAREFFRYYFHWLEERFPTILLVVIAVAFTVCVMDLRADWRFLTQLDSLDKSCRQQHKVLVYANQHFGCLALNGKTSWYVQTSEEQ